MPSIELSKLQAVTAPRALSDTDRMTGKPAGEKLLLAGGGTPAADPGVSIEVGTSLDTAAPPVNSDRVAEIKTALKNGDYPLIPAEIADAIIAAQVSFGLDQ